VFLYQLVVPLDLLWLRDFIDVARARLPRGRICLFVVFQPGKEELPPVNILRE
jgi:hypothetical protein